MPAKSAPQQEVDACDAIRTPSSRHHREIMHGEAQTMLTPRAIAMHVHTRSKHGPHTPSQYTSDDLVARGASCRVMPNAALVEGQTPERHDAQHTAEQGLRT